MDFMIATKESFEPHSSEQLPKSKKVYVAGKLHPEVRVPMREIELAPTKILGRGSKDDGRGEKSAAPDTRHASPDTLEVNEPVRVYDCSGPWGDPTFTGSVEQGLPALRRDWILKRGDVEEHAGREVKPIDDGYLSEQHRGLSHAKRQDETSLRLEGLTAPRRRTLRAKKGKVVTQLAYARAGIITPEMEFIAIREQMRVAQASRLSADSSRIGDLSHDNIRNDLNKQHAGSSQLVAAVYDRR